MRNFVKPERFLLKAQPEFSEKWVQKLIADDPSILGLGDLVLRDQERIQPRAGRLDLLLQDLRRSAATKSNFSSARLMKPT